MSGNKSYIVYIFPSVCESACTLAFDCDLLLEGKSLKISNTQTHVIIPQLPENCETDTKLERDFQSYNVKISDALHCYVRVMYMHVGA